MTTTMFKYKGLYVYIYIYTIYNAAMWNLHFEIITATATYMYYTLFAAGEGQGETAVSNLNVKNVKIFYENKKNSFRVYKLFLLIFAYAIYV